MFEGTENLLAQIKVLEFKLDSIRKYAKSRSSIVDPITKVELDNILALISKFETVPTTWELKDPLVPISDITEDEENV